jgi:hypothetical protein
MALAAGSHGTNTMATGSNKNALDHVDRESNAYQSNQRQSSSINDPK